MHRLCHAHVLARLVLAWFVLTLGAAIASPVLQPQQLQLVCSAGTMQLVQVQPDGDIGQPPVTHTLDCPMCGTAGAPPPAAVALPALQPLGHVLQPIPAARHAARIAAPLPARGPPLAA